MRRQSDYPKEKVEWRGVFVYIDLSYSETGDWTLQLTPYYARVNVAFVITGTLDQLERVDYIRKWVETLVLADDSRERLTNKLTAKVTSILADHRAVCSAP